MKHTDFDSLISNALKVGTDDAITKALDSARVANAPMPVYHALYGAMTKDGFLRYRGSR